MTTEYLTVKDIANMTDVSRQAIDKRIKGLKIAGRKFGRTRVFTRDEVQPILEATFRT